MPDLRPAGLIPETSPVHDDPEPWSEAAAFMAFSEAAGLGTDIPTLVQVAADVLRGVLGDADIHVHDLGPDALPTVDVPNLPGVAQALRARELVVTPAGVGPDGADPDRADPDRAGDVAVLPLYVAQQPRALLTVRVAALPPGGRPALVGVGRALALALGRADHVTRLGMQNAELAARTEVLQGFAELSRELALEDDPLTLVGRAQDLVVSLLPRTVSTYYELSGETWQLRSHRGEFRNPALLAGLQRGLPRGRTVNVDRPFDSHGPNYQDRHDPASVQAVQAEIVVIRTSASFPVFQGGEVRGVLVVGVHERRSWTSVERALLETIVGSLSLALERAAQAGALRVRTLELERSTAELQQFTHVASHDLQEPLRAVTSFSQLLMARFSDTDDPKAQLYMQFVREGTARMAQLIQDLLTFSRVGSQAVPLTPVQPDVAVTLALHDLAVRVQDSGGRVEVGPLPPVMADASQLQQLLRNVIGNALKFRAPERPPVVNVTAVPDGDLVRFAVQDNGIGIGAEYFEQIFTIFQRLHTREAYGGSGIGLAIARKIVERHGGTITVASTPGEGSTFTFTLPAAPRK